MKVNFTLSQYEIEELVRAKVASLMALPEGVQLETNFVAGRGSEGGRVEVSIDTESATSSKSPFAASAPVAPKAKGPAVVKVVAAPARPQAPEPETAAAEEAKAAAVSRPDFSQARAALADRLVAESKQEGEDQDAPATDSEAVAPMEIEDSQPPFEKSEPEITAEAPVPATPTRPVFGALKRPDNRT